MRHMFTPNYMNWSAVHSGDTVTMASGIYHLTEPLVFTGLRDVNIEGVGTTLSGCKTIRAEWVKHGDNIYSAAVEMAVPPDALMIGNKKFRMARYPHYDPAIKPLGGYAADCLEFAARCAHPKGAFLHALHIHLWGDTHYRIIGLDAQGQPLLEGGWQNNRPMGMHAQYRYVENLREALGADGEFYYDSELCRIWVCSATEPENDIGVVGIPYLMRLEQCERVSLNGLVFADTARTFMSAYEPLTRSDWCIHRGGALFIEECTGVNVEDCDFTRLGGNALFVSGNVSEARIERCHFYDVGASCVCFVGKPSCIRYEFNNYDDKCVAVDESSIGPADDQYPRDCVVADCLMHDLGTVEKQSAAVEISMAARITVRDCTMYSCPRAAINIGENSFGGHLIEGCDAFDTVLETGDHGTFNSWGRDRYWNANWLDAQTRQALALKDACEPITLRNNRFRCDHGWDIDLDDGSSNYIIEGNLCLNGGIKLREGFKRICRYNMTINNSVHFHVWFDGSGDVVEHNVIMTPYKPIGMKYRWGESVDYNILFRPSAATTHADELSALSGQDLHSVVSDIHMSELAHGEYRMPDEECARLSFRNLPEHFGIRCTRLKALMETTSNNQ